MAKMYTLDEKLLCGSPEIRIGGEIFAVDDRKNTVKKVMALFKKEKENTEDSGNFDNLDEVLKLAFGKRYSDIEKLDLSFNAYQSLVRLVMSAMTGKEPDEPDESENTNFRS